MGKCQICKKRYPQWVEYCSGCQIEIVKEFDGFSKEKTFVEVYRTGNVALAGLIKEVLDDHRIICYLGNYFIAHIYSPFFSPVKVMVYREDVEYAEEVINLFF